MLKQEYIDLMKSFGLTSGLGGQPSFAGSLSSSGSIAQESSRIIEMKYPQQVRRPISMTLSSTTRSSPRRRSSKAKPTPSTASDERLVGSTRDVAVQKMYAILKKVSNPEPLLMEEEAPKPPRIVPGQRLVVSLTYSPDEHMMETPPLTAGQMHLGATNASGTPSSSRVGTANHSPAPNSTPMETVGAAPCVIMYGTVSTTITQMLLEYTIKEYMGVCFSIEFVVPASSQLWTLFVPSSAALLHLLRVWTLQPSDFNNRKLGLWLLLCTRLVLVDSCIVASSHDQSRFKQLYLAELVGRMNMAIVPIQSVARSFLALKKVRRLLQLAIRREEGRKVAEWRTFKRSENAAREAKVLVQSSVRGAFIGPSQVLSVAHGEVVPCMMSELAEEYSTFSSLQQPSISSLSQATFNNRGSPHRKLYMPSWSTVLSPSPETSQDADLGAPPSFYMAARAKWGRLADRLLPLSGDGDMGSQQFSTTLHASTSSVYTNLGTTRSPRTERIRYEQKAALAIGSPSYRSEVDLLSLKSELSKAFELAQEEIKRLKSNLTAARAEVDWSDFDTDGMESLVTPARTPKVATPLPLAQSQAEASYTSNPGTIHESTPSVAADETEHSLPCQAEQTVSVSSGEEALAVATVGGENLATENSAVPVATISPGASLAQDEACTQEDVLKTPFESLAIAADASVETQEPEAGSADAEAGSADVSFIQRELDMLLSKVSRLDAELEEQRKLAVRIEERSRIDAVHLQLQAARAAFEGSSGTERLDKVPESSTHDTSPPNKGIGSDGKQVQRQGGQALMQGHTSDWIGTHKLQVEQQRDRERRELQLLREQQALLLGQVQEMLLQQQQRQQRFQQAALMLSMQKSQQYVQSQSRPNSQQDPLQIDGEYVSGISQEAAESAAQVVDAPVRESETPNTKLRRLLAREMRLQKERRALRKDALAKAARAMLKPVKATQDLDVANRGVRLGLRSGYYPLCVASISSAAQIVNAAEKTGVAVSFSVNTKDIIRAALMNTASQTLLNDVFDLLTYYCGPTTDTTNGLSAAERIKALGREGVVGMIIYCVSNHVENAVVCFKASRLMLRLCSNEAIRQKLSRPGVCRLLAKTLSLHAKNASNVEGALRVVSSLSNGGQEVLTKSGICEAIMQAFQAQWSVQKLVVLLCKCINRLCGPSGSGTNTGQAKFASLAPKFVELLQKSFNREDVYEQICWLTVSIFKSAPGKKKSTLHLEAGMIQTLYAALTHPSSPNGVCRMSVWALSNLLAPNYDPHKDLNHQILRTLKSLESEPDEELQMHAKLAIRRITGRGPSPDRT